MKKAKVYAQEILAEYHWDQWQDLNTGLHHQVLEAFREETVEMLGNKPLAFTDNLCVILGQQHDKWVATVKLFYRYAGVVPKDIKSPKHKKIFNPKDYLLYLYVWLEKNMSSLWAWNKPQLDKLLFVKGIQTPEELAKG